MLLKKTGKMKCPDVYCILRNLSGLISVLKLLRIASLKTEAGCIYSSPRNTFMHEGILEANFKKCSRKKK